MDIGSHPKAVIVDDIKIGGRQFIKAMLCFRLNTAKVFCQKRRGITVQSHSLRSDLGTEVPIIQCVQMSENSLFRESFRQACNRPGRPSGKFIDTRYNVTNTNRHVADR